MINQDGVQAFVKIWKESRDQGTGSDWFWIVGSGVTAAVTGNRIEATWLGLARSALDHVQANSPDPGSIIAGIVKDGLANWRPSPDDFWAVIGILDSKLESLGGPAEGGCKRWIHRRMEELARNVSDPGLIEQIASFHWPIATTNYDNILEEVLRRELQLFGDMGETQIEDWRRTKNQAAPILHLHGHCTREEGLLFTREQYARYIWSDAFRRNIDRLFQGRPVFVGCKDTLTDPNIGKALTDHFATHKNFSLDPLVLLRSSERLSLRSEARQIPYGDEHDDLAAFLEAVVAGIHNGPSIGTRGGGQQAGQLSAASTWRVYFRALSDDFRWLHLPDFRTADRDVPLPLDDIYLALKFDHRASSERLEESRVLHRIQVNPADKESESALPELNVRVLSGVAPQQDNVTLADILAWHPCSVILGDPGSGKTTMTHWLMRQCAMARFQQRADLVVESARLNPDIAADALPTRVGPAWFPVMITISEYVKRRSELGVNRQKRMQRFAAMSMSERFQQAGMSLSIEDAEERLNQEAASGRLLMMLDGLDESVKDEERRDIVDEAEALMRWLFGAYGVGADDAPKITPVRFDNRVLITTRIAGYKYAPFSIEVPHYRVEPLSLSGAARLLSSLFVAVGSVQPDDAEASAPSLSTLRDDLLRRLRAEGSAGLGSMASSPVLASALFTLQIASEGKLPRDRRGLYEGMIDLFMLREARRMGTTDEKRTAAQLRHMFQQMAFEAFNSPDSTLISESLLKSKIAAAEWADPSLLGESQLPFGPLVPKAPGQYGFLHRTFQEYLCAEYLADMDRSFGPIVDLAGMPTWSEPARLAFMIWATRQANPERRNREIDTLRDGSVLGNAFRPLSLALSAIGETTEADAALVEKLIDAAIDALANALPNWRETPLDLSASLSQLGQKQAGAIALRERLEAAVSDIQHSTDAHSKRRLVVASRLIVSLDLFDDVIEEALQSAYPCDEESSGWPVSSALLRSITPDLKTHAISDCDTIDKEFPGRGGLRANLPTEVQYLEKHPQLLREKLRDGPWARLLTALLGGQRDYRLAENTALYEGIASFLQLADDRRITAFLPVKWLSLAQQKRKSTDDPDPIYELAVFLDTEGGHAVKRAAKIRPGFRLQSSVFPARLWPEIRMRIRQPASLAASVSPVLEAAVLPHPPQGLSEEDRAEMRNLQFRLADAARRTLRSMSESKAREILTVVPAPYQAALVDALAAVGSSLGEREPLKAFSNCAGWNESTLSATAGELIRGEHLAATSSLFSDDRRYSAAQWLDDHGEREYVRLAGLCRAQSHKANGRSDMPHLPSPYIGSGSIAGIVDDLTALERFPPTLTFLAQATMTALIKEDDNRFSFPEVAAVLSRLPWVPDDGAVWVEKLGLDPWGDAESLRVALEREPTLSNLRARIRLLAGLTEEEREREESALEESLCVLPPGLMTAQFVELLLERARFLDTRTLIAAALSVEGLAIHEAACLRLRLLPLIDDQEERSKLVLECFRFAGMVPDEAIRVDLLHVISQQQLLIGINGVQLFETVVSQVDDPVLHAYACNRTGAVLSALADGVMAQDPDIGGESWAPLIVYAKLGDALAQANRNAGSNSLDDPLGAVERAQKTKDQGLIAQAVALASISSPRGLPSACRKLLADYAGLDFADQLEAITTVSHEGLGPESLDGLVSALDCGFDEVRARARALLLPAIELSLEGGGISGTGSGLQTLLRLGHLRNTTSREGIRVQLAWRMELTIPSSVELANALLDLGDRSGDEGKAARWVIQGFKHMTPAVETIFAARVPVCSPELRFSIWWFASKLAHFHRSKAKGTNEEQEPVGVHERFFQSGLPCSPDPIFPLVEPHELIEELRFEDDPRKVVENLTEKYGRSMSSLFDHCDAAALESVRTLGRTFFSRSGTMEERNKEVQQAADRLLQIDHGPRRAAVLLAHLISVSVTDPRPGTYLRSELAVTLAAAAERSPARIVASLEKPEYREMLTTIASSANSFPARRAAFLLMGHIFDQADQQPFPLDIAALTTVMLDVPDVIDAALAAASRIRILSSRGMARLRDVLRGQSAARASLAGRMLIAIARNKETAQAVRTEIMRDVETFLTDAKADRRVYFGMLDATTPPAPTIREQLLAELSASSGGVVQMQ